MKQNLTIASIITLTCLCFSSIKAYSPIDELAPDKIICDNCNGSCIITTLNNSIVNDSIKEISDSIPQCNKCNGDGWLYLMDN